jgi:hypothetical protein
MPQQAGFFFSEKLTCDGSRCVYSAWPITACPRKLPLHQRVRVRTGEGRGRGRRWRWWLRLRLRVVRAVTAAPMGRGYIFEVWSSGELLRCIKVVRGSGWDPMVGTSAAERWGGGGAKTASGSRRPMGAERWWSSTTEVTELTREEAGPVACSPILYIKPMKKASAPNILGDSCTRSCRRLTRSNM